MSVVKMPAGFASFSITPPTWSASSRVGTSTSACSHLCSRLMRSMSGRPKASVLPEPVNAWPITSRPSSNGGMDDAWIGVGTSICIKASVLRLDGLKANSVNEDKWIPFVRRFLLDDQCERHHRCSWGRSQRTCTEDTDALVYGSVMIARNQGSALGRHGRPL